MFKSFCLGLLVPWLVLTGYLMSVNSPVYTIAIPPVEKPGYVSIQTDAWRVLEISI